MGPHTITTKSWINTTRGTCSPALVTVCRYSADALNPLPTTGYRAAFIARRATVTLAIRRMGPLTESVGMPRFRFCLSLHLITEVISRFGEHSHRSVGERLKVATNYELTRATFLVYE